MKVCFLLPGVSRRRPIGGYKMVYIYANALVERGWDVEIAYAAKFDLPVRRLRSRISPYLRYAYYHLTGNFKQVKWMPLHPAIHSRLVWNYSQLKSEKDCVYVTTAIQTVAPFLRSGISPEKAAYFIQGYENWFVADDDVKASYRAGMQNVVIAKWLHQIIKDAGADAVFIPNGFDPQKFYLSTPVNKRTPKSVLMLHHTQKEKGSKYGIETLQILKEKYPEMRATLFGAKPKPADLPEWIDYHHRPLGEELRKLYNEHAVFMATSVVEGWGLTVGEAMLCGCAVACTDAGGFKEMAIDGRNALITPIRDSKAMAESVSQMFDDDNLRIKLAEQAMNDIKDFTLEASVEAWDKVLKNILKK